MSRNPLDLNGLTMDDIDFSGARDGLKKIREIEKEYQKKYGDNWREHYFADVPIYSDVDSCEKTVNEAIYNGYEPCISGALQFYIQDLYWKKMKQFFGPFYKRYVNHKPNDLKVNKALLKDAVKSGKWKELPSELHAEYHKMAGD